MYHRTEKKYIVNDHLQYIKYYILNVYFFIFYLYNEEKRFIISRKNI